MVEHGIEAPHLGRRIFSVKHWRAHVPLWRHRLALIYQEGQCKLSQPSGSHFIARVVEMLKRELSSHNPRIKLEAAVVRCAIPSVGAFLVVHVMDSRVYWETVPAALNDSRDIKTDNDWDSVFGELETQVRGWSVTL